MNGRGDKALGILERIYGSRDEAAGGMKETQDSIAGEFKTPLSALFEKGIFKAVLVGAAIAILGQFMGVNAVLYYGPKIFADAGFEDPLFSTVLVGVVNMLTTVIALLIIDRVGRKKLVWWGVGGMIFCLLMIGLYFSAPGLPTWFMLTFFLLYVFCTAISISAVVFVILSGAFGTAHAAVETVTYTLDRTDNGYSSYTYTLKGSDGTSGFIWDSRHTSPTEVRACLASLNYLLLIRLYKNFR